MGGGLMQLVAYGAQDIYLTGNPQITFFKVVYRRHTNFSMEAIEQTFNGSVADDSAGTVTATISRNGDLVGRTYIVMKTLDSGAVNPGAQIITSVVLEIGGQQIDKHTGSWLEVYSELTEPNSIGTNNADPAAAAGTLFQSMACMGGCLSVGTTLTDGAAHIPLQFWFCRNPGLALPLIALQYHEVKIIIEFAAATDASGHSLWVDYIYLDTDERRRFAQVSHEYLIEQVQEQTLSAFSGTSNSADLNFNHPVKELVWADVTTKHLPTTLTNQECKFNLKLNGHDRFAARPGTYFTRTQVWQHHTGFGSVSARDSICVYSFALKPEEHQPSGTCNFSRIDNAQLIHSAVACTNTFTVWAVNYNVLRIMSGMGGLAYSN